MQHGAGFKDQAAARLVLSAANFQSLEGHAHQADGFRDGEEFLNVGFREVEHKIISRE
jgi:hypothetical protein